MMIDDGHISKKISFSIINLLKEVAGDSVQRLHDARARRQGCSQLLGLAELTLCTPSGPVAAVHHHPVLGQLVQGKGVDDVSRHSKNNKRLAQSVLEAELGLAWGP